MNTAGDGEEEKEEEEEEEEKKDKKKKRKKRKKIKILATRANGHRQGQHGQMAWDRVSTHSAPSAISMVSHS